ncbi:MAG: DNA-binding protein [Spirochaetaceae bacterium]|nr:MAG: DNA-binding protein [Spirochaetaceae bacterium]
MAKDLTVSQVDRQNILNNPYALDEIRKGIGVSGIIFKGRPILLKEQVAEFFEVSERTIENYVSRFESELAENGYAVLKGKYLQELKLVIAQLDVPETVFGNIKRTPQLSIFDYRAFLNLAMLITESEKARVLRQVILDIAIDTINRKTGGGTKYINQREEEFLASWFEEENYRKQFTDALKNHVDMGNAKYAIYTNRIYVSIFKEDAQEYRRILKLHEKDTVRDTFYSEILDLVAAYEVGMAEIITRKAESLGRKLTAHELDSLFLEFEQKAHWKPLVQKARMKMASRDMAFRDALHLQLQEYIAPINPDEFERFLGEKSKELHERLEEAKEVMKRLKERD